MLSMKQLFLLTLLISILSTSLSSGCHGANTFTKNQDTNLNKNNIPSITNTTDEARRIFNTEGWQIPSLANATIKNPRRLVPTMSEGDHKCYVTTYKTNEDQIIDLNRFTQEQQKLMFLDKRNWLILLIKKYDINGKTFCYAIESEPKGILMIFEFDYYDENGDGKFEVIELNSPTEKLKIPDWVFQK